MGGISNESISTRSGQLKLLNRLTSALRFKTDKNLRISTSMLSRLVHYSLLRATGGHLVHGHCHLAEDRQLVQSFREDEHG